MLGVRLDAGESGLDGAAQRVAEHDHERRLGALDRELDAADLGRCHDGAGDADHEEVARALVEEHLDRHA